MNWIEAITAILSGIAGLGIFEFIKWLFTKDEEKEGLKLDNEGKSQEIRVAARQEALEEWSRLTAQYGNDAEYYRASLQDKDLKLADKDELLEKKDKTIEELRNKINDLTSENTALELYRCVLVGCTSRTPPFAAVRLNIKDGRIDTKEDVDKPEE